MELFEREYRAVRLELKSQEPQARYTVGSVIAVIFNTDNLMDSYIRWSFPVAALLLAVLFEVARTTSSSIVWSFALLSVPTC